MITCTDIGAAPTAEKVRGGKLSLGRLPACPSNEQWAGHPRTAMLTRIARICALQIVLATTAFYSAAWADDSPFGEKDRAALVMGTQAKLIIKADFTRYNRDFPEKSEADGRILHDLAARLAAMQAEGNEMACSNQIFLEARGIRIRRGARSREEERQ